MNLWESGFSKVPQAGRYAACKADLDPDLEQGGNTDIVVRRDPATGEMSRVLVHRSCRPGRSPRSTSDALADASAVCGKPARTVLGLGGPQGLPGYPTVVEPCSV